MTALAQLLCGWAVVTLESSGTGVGVVARSGNWPAALGSTTRELGPLVTWDGPPGMPESFALEFTLVRGFAVAVLKTPSNARPGTCVAHLVAGDRATLDGATTLSLYDSGRFLTTVDDPRYPVDHWDPISKPLDSNGFAASADAYLDLDWLPALLGYTLAYLSGRGPAIELRVEDATDALSMLRALYGILPRNSLRDLTFCTMSAPASDAAITAVTRDSHGPAPGNRRIVTPGDRGDESDPYVQLGQQIVGHRRAGITIPETLSTAEEIGAWCFRRHLRTLVPAELDDDRLAEVITDPELSPEWFRDKTVATRAIQLAIGRPSVARALVHIDHLPSVRRTFEKALTDRVTNDTRDRTRTLELARQLGFDLGEAVAAAARRRLETGHGQLSAADAAAVWPRLHADWATGNSKRRQTIAGYLSQHRALREHALGSRDRALVHKALRVEVDDPGVPTGGSRLLHTAMHANLAIVAQVAVDVACDGRDHYALEQILACAPHDRLPALLAECARYPALPALDLMKALTLTRSDPAELVEALRPAWHDLRRALGLPAPIEDLVELDTADPASGNGHRIGIRLPRRGFRRRYDKDRSRAELSTLLQTADEFPPTVQAREIIDGALHSDLEYLVSNLVTRTRSADGPQVLERVLALAPADQLPTLVTACARQWDLPPATLLHAIVALRLSPAELAEALAGGWPWLRTRLDLPQVIAPLLTLVVPQDDPTDSWTSLALDPDGRRARRFWR
ncbi:hypothetical protein GPX89_29670 [Nocardia sp. ET3-3]|uniref:Uncharacterized protein n=1 Tax=Nocardia terrae TaxID=2675851 RepID=A0A7K1V429_9NOCA|nr:hypothetical protein [Nocardia terrae]MVU81400.1 hypothetical protein [Nocardia terrae]